MKHGKKKKQSISRSRQKNDSDDWNYRQLRNFKIIKTDMLKNIMENVDKMCEQIENFSRVINYKKSTK